MTRMEMIKNEDAWPLWPVLPVKAYTNKMSIPNCAIMVAGHGPKVYEVNLMNLKKGPINPQLEGAKVHEYASYEELVKAGWVVD